MEETNKSHRKPYDWLKQYQFQKGNNANPNGRPKGKSLKTFAREMLESLPDEEKANYLKEIDPKIVWEMAEGRARQDVEADIKGNLIISISEDIAKKYDINPVPEDNSEGQTQV